MVSEASRLQKLPQKPVSTSGLLLLTLTDDPRLNSWLKFYLQQETIFLY